MYWLEDMQHQEAIPSEKKSPPLTDQHDDDGLEDPNMETNRSEMT
jgi:hypothetical protein